MTEISNARKEEIANSFSKQGLMKTFNATLEEVSAGRIMISMPYADSVSQQHQYFHGGVIGALGDSACGYAAITLIPNDSAALTAEYKINLLAPADGNRLVAIGKVLKAGRTLVVCQGDVFVESQGKRTLCATMLMTMCVIKNLGHK